MIDKPIIHVDHLTKRVQNEKNQVSLEILKDISFEAKKGEFLSVVGPSGSGKTTLLHCVSGLSMPTRGEVHILGENPYQLKPAKAAEFRRSKIGFIFQSYNLIEALPAFENIVLPLRLARKKIDRKKIEALLGQLQFKADAHHFVSALSGGEKQKIAIARVLVANAQVVFADEPTGALDSVSGKIVFDLLRYLADQGVCVVMVTHDIELAAKTDRALVMRDGKLVQSISDPTARVLFEQLNERLRE